MSIDWKSGLVKALGHDDRGGFMPNTGKCFKFFESVWDMSVVLLNELLGKIPDRFCLGWTQPTGADHFLNVFDGEFDHGLWSGSECKQLGGDLIDPHIGALRREKHGDEKGVDVRV